MYNNYINRHCEKWRALNELNVKRGSAFCEWVLTSGREFKQGLRLKWNYLTNVRVHGCYMHTVVEMCLQGVSSPRVVKIQAASDS